AMHYGALAGDQSVHAFANTEATEHYARAIAAASKIPLVPPRELADLHAKRGAVLSIVGRHQEALDEYARALEYAGRSSDRALEGRLLVGLSWAHFNAHQIDEMLENSRRAEKLAKELGNSVLQLSSLIASGMGVGVRDGVTPGTIQEVQEAMRLAVTLPEPRLLAQTTTILGQLAQWQGDFERGAELLSKGLQFAREAHAGFIVGQSLFFSAHVALSLAEYERALDLYRQ